MMNREELLTALVVGELDPALAAVQQRFDADPDLRAEWAALAATIEQARQWDEVRETLSQRDTEVAGVDVHAAIRAFRRDSENGAAKRGFRHWPTLSIAFAAAAALLLLLLFLRQSNDQAAAPGPTLGGRAMALAPDAGPLPPNGELVWEAAADAVSFVVEIELASGDRISSRELTSPTWALLTEHPQLHRQPLRWRVLTLSTDGTESASYWARVLAP